MSEPKPGDAVWWRGMRMKIIHVDGRIVRYQNIHPDGPYRCASAKASLRWDPTFEFWYMPGTEGEMPKVTGEGKVVDPEPPHCTNCGKVTFRRGLCTNCRLEAAGVS